MRTDACVSLYLRDNQVLVIPSVYHEIEPVMIVEPVEAEVQRAIEQALQVARTAPIPEGDYDPKNWVVPKALGLKSAKAFHTNVAHASVLLYEGKIEVLPYRPTKRGQAFEGNGAHVPVPNEASIAAIALDVLKASPRLNPRP
jgi:hypothetical protein